MVRVLRDFFEVSWLKVLPMSVAGINLAHILRKVPATEGAMVRYFQKERHLMARTNEHKI